MERHHVPGSVGGDVESRPRLKMGPTLTQQWFPHSKHPLIISAPMFGYANAKLATEVTKAGGLGELKSSQDLSCL